MLTGPQLGAAIDAARIKKQLSKKALADHFHVKPPSVQKWIAQGTIDKAKLSELWRFFSDVVGPEHWGLSGSDWMDNQPAAKGMNLYPVSQVLRHIARETAPRHLDWESIVKSPLEAEFQTVMPDASMAPDIPKGARIIFVTGVTAEPGDFVLLADKDGSIYLREYKQLRLGQWEAHAINPAFLPMQGAGLEILAVFDGLRGRRAR